MNRHRIPRTPQRQPLSSMLRQTQLRSMLLAMGLAGLSLTFLGLLAMRSYAEHQLQLLARSLSYALEAAVVFSDAAAAQESLKLIAAEETVEVSVMDRNGESLADWRPIRKGIWSYLERKLADNLLPQPLIRPILHQDEIVGELRLSGQGANIGRFLRNGLLALFGCLVVSSLMAYYGSRRLQRKLMTPLEQLSEVAHGISHDRTFTRRVPSSHIIELDTLAEDFNRLLDEIEAWQNQLQRENASLAHQASHDSLTRLPNRTQFEPALSQAAHDARNSSSRFAVMFLDCNHFKEINDKLGHAAGDQVLISIAERLRRQLRSSDLVVRLGGDEFAVLITPLNTDADAQRVAQKILASMAAPIELADGGNVLASLSIGIAIYPTHANDLESLVHQADVAMYKAKRNRTGHQIAFRCGT